MARTLHKFVNEVRWRNHLPSWNKLKKDTQKLGKELGKMYNPEIPEPSIPRSPRQPRRRLDDNDAHIKQYRKRLEAQQKLNEAQEDAIEDLFLSSRAMRQLSEEAKEDLRTRIRTTKTTKGLRREIRAIKKEQEDVIHNDKRRNRELKKQNLAQKRLTASTEQMVGALASVYTGVAAVGAVVDTGMQFEKFNKTFLAVSSSAEEAADHIAFVREQAHRMGTDVIESGLSYSRMLAAVGNKVPLEQVRDAFLAIGESATVLGLSQDDTAGAMRAMTQAMGKQKFQAEELRQQMGDRLPVAITAMELAAKDAGLAIDEVGLDKLMEQGKLTMDLLPFLVLD